MALPRRTSSQITHKLLDQSAGDSRRRAGIPGGFHRATLEAIFGGARAVAADPGFGDLPTLWIHGEGDVLATLDATTEAMKHLRGSNIEQHVYRGAHHEILNEFIRTKCWGTWSGFCAERWNPSAGREGRVAWWNINQVAP
jgi:alpha-beta hydrolase superfamily lysophospholipase